MGTLLLQVRNISKSYAGAPLLRDVSFDVDAGEIVCLLGPSGTGKTTLLRIIAGLETPEAGEVLLEGRNLNPVPIHLRGLGLMFQDLALFPHRSVYENVAFGLRMQNQPERALRARVDETLELVGLDAGRFGGRDVNHLSGGEQQRVALARTLAPRPRFLMFDEPLGALDRILREQLVVELRALLRRIGMTALYVTHDQEEASAIADRLVILNNGSVQQIGAPAELYRHPANAFVARFLGLANLIPARVTANDGGQLRAETRIGTFEFEGSAPTGTEGFVLLRPRALRQVSSGPVSDGALAPEPALGVRLPRPQGPSGAAPLARGTGGNENVARGVVLQTFLRAGHSHILVDCGNQQLSFEWERPVSSGERVELGLNPHEISFISGQN